MAKKQPLIRIRFSYIELKTIATSNPEYFMGMIAEHGWDRMTWATKHDLPKLRLIQDFIKDPDKYRDYWQKKNEALHRGKKNQLDLFE